jgi:hypothetical protein
MSAVKRSGPQTPEEWQIAVNCAAALRVILDCNLYGLLKGCPRIDIDRCDEILSQAAARGINTSMPPADLAVGMIHAINAEAASKGSDE